MTRRALRIFLKPSNANYVDFPLEGDTTMTMVLRSWRLEGVLVCDIPASAVAFAIPWDGWGFMAEITGAPMTAAGNPLPTVVPFTPKPPGGAA